jgi:dTMP kinase
MPGRFVVFEGGDASGKSTQVRLLAAALGRLGLGEVVTTREPGGTPLGSQIRNLLLHGDHVVPRAEALLYAADRAEHVAAVILPALARGAIVVSDRFVDSSIAYQADGRGLPEAEVRAINEVATGGLIPDLTVLLDIAPGTAHARRDGPGDRIEAEDALFHSLVRDRYLLLARAKPSRYLILDASGPADLIHREVLAGTRAILGLSGNSGEEIA